MPLAGVDASPDVNTDVAARFRNIRLPSERIGAAAGLAFLAAAGNIDELITNINGRVATI